MLNLRARPLCTLRMRVTWLLTILGGSWVIVIKFSWFGRFLTGTVLLCQSSLLKTPFIRHHSFFLELAFACYKTRPVILYLGTAGVTTVNLDYRCVSSGKPLRLDWITEPFLSSYDCATCCPVVSSSSVTAATAGLPTHDHMSHRRQVLFWVRHFPSSQYNYNQRRNRELC